VLAARSSGAAPIDRLANKVMRTCGTTLVGNAGHPRVPDDAGGGPAVSPPLVGDVGGGRGDDDGIVDLTSLTTKKGANMTERVPVPSSEHVAEIVGRQGKCSRIWRPTVDSITTRYDTQYFKSVQPFNKYLCCRREAARCLLSV